MDTSIVHGRAIYLFTRPDGTVSVEKPSCCRRIFPETETMNKEHRVFGKKEIDVANRTKWNRLLKRLSPTNEDDVFNSAESICADIDDLLKDDF